MIQKLVLANDVGDQFFGSGRKKAEMQFVAALSRREKTPLSQKIVARSQPASQLVQRLCRDTPLETRVKENLVKRRHVIRTSHNGSEIHTLAVSIEQKESRPALRSTRIGTRLKRRVIYDKVRFFKHPYTITVLNRNHFLWCSR